MFYLRHSDYYKMVSKSHFDLHFPIAKDNEKSETDSSLWFLVSQDSRSVRDPVGR